MKKILFFMTFLFAVVCYAAPPPDLLPDIIPTGQVEFVQDIVNAPVFTFEAQEVAFTDIGNSYQFTSQSMYAEPAYEVKVPEALVIRHENHLQGLIRPHTLTEMQGFGNNFRLNKQNSNYGYPFGARLHFIMDA